MDPEILMRERRNLHRTEMLFNALGSLALAAGVTLEVAAVMAHDRGLLIAGGAGLFAGILSLRTAEMPGRSGAVVDTELLEQNRLNHP